MENEKVTFEAEEAEVRYRYADLEDRLVEFAVMTTDVAELLPTTRTDGHIAGQLVRCATSPMLNYGEAQGAESRQDFIHKMKVALKELRETRVCIKFIRRKRLVSDFKHLEKVEKECNQLVSIFIKSITTAKRIRRTGSNLFYFSFFIPSFSFKKCHNLLITTF